MKIDDLHYAKEGPFYGAEVRTFATPPIGDDRDLWLQGPDEDFLIRDDSVVHDAKMLGIAAAIPSVSPWATLSPPYATIVVDPPWHYEKTNADKSGEDYKGKKGLAYSSMTLDEIKAMPIESLGDDSRLFLWITNRYLRHGWDILESWGYEPQDRTLVWCKSPRATTPVTTEFVLIGKRGKPEKMPWHGTTWFQWSHQKAHSVKPDAFMDLVESWCPGPYVELFAREPRFGWDAWGKGFET